MRNPTLLATLATLTALLSVLVAALQSKTAYPRQTRPPGAGAEARIIQRLRFRSPDLGRERCPVKRPRHEPTPSNTTTASPSVANTTTATPASSSAASTAGGNSTAATPLGAGSSNAASPPVLRFNLSSTGTLNLTPYLPDQLTSGGNTIPVLLDMLAGCSWVASKGMRCVDGLLFSGSDSKSGTDTPTNATTEPGESCVRDVHGGLEGAVAGVDPTTLESLSANVQPEAQKGRCGHYLAGAVFGPIVQVSLQLEGALLDSNSADEARNTLSAPFLVAETFSAAAGNEFSEFQRYYGGGSGVLGLALGINPSPGQDTVGMPSQPANNADTSNGERHNSSTAALAVQGEGDIFPTKPFLPSIFDAWAWEYTGSNRTFGLALPRDGEVGTFLIGAPIREVLAREGAVDVTIVEEAVLSMSPSPLDNSSPGPAKAAMGWDGMYGIPSVRISAEGIISGSSPVNLPATQHEAGDGSEAGERYLIDSALPIIWTSHSLAAQIASLFDPPGWVEVPYSPTTNASDTNTDINDNDSPAAVGFNSTNHPGTGNWTYPTTWGTSPHLTNSTIPSRPNSVYRVACDARPPNITLHLSDGHDDNSEEGVEVPLFPPDLIVRMRLREGWECMSAFQDGDLVVESSGLSEGSRRAAEHLLDDPDSARGGGSMGPVSMRMRRLGWPFLRNVLLDFDLGFVEGGQVGVAVRAWPAGWSGAVANQTHAGAADGGTESEGEGVSMQSASTQPSATATAMVIVTETPAPQSQTRDTQTASTSTQSPSSEPNTSSSVVSTTVVVTVTGGTSSKGFETRKTTATNSTSSIGGETSSSASAAVSMTGSAASASSSSVSLQEMTFPTMTTSHG